MELIAIPGGYAIGKYHQEDASRSFFGEAAYRYFYRKQWSLVDGLARVFADVINEKFTETDLIIGIPGTRLIDFDPICLLVDWINSYTNIERMVNVLSRYGIMSEYGDVDSKKGGFELKCLPETIKGKNIVLIDGIVGNGSIIEKAKKTLESAGAKVTVLILTKFDRKFSSLESLE